MRSFSVLLAVALLVAVALAAEDVPSLNEKEKEAVDKSHLASVTGEDVEALSQVRNSRDCPIQSRLPEMTLLKFKCFSFSVVIQSYFGCYSLVCWSIST